MKQLASLCFLAAVVLGLLEHMDRTSAAALTVVEWSQRIGVPLFVLATMLGIASLVMGMFAGTKTAPPSPADRRKEPPRPSRSGTGERLSLREARTLPPLDPIDPSKTVSAHDPTWRDQIRALAQDLDLGKGARMSIDFSTTTPLTLHLEHLSPAHCKRAITAVGSMTTLIPTPPRLKVVFDHCPQAGVPRHHQVAGALAQAIPRGQFRVVSHVDTVDVMFLHPDPAWSAPVLNS